MYLRPIPMVNAFTTAVPKVKVKQVQAGIIRHLQHVDNPSNRFVFIAFQDGKREKRVAQCYVLHCQNGEPEVTPTPRCRRWTHGQNATVSWFATVIIMTDNLSGNPEMEVDTPIVPEFHVDRLQRALHKKLCYMAPSVDKIASIRSH